MNNNKIHLKRNILLAVTAVAACAALAACSKANTAGAADYGTADPDAADSATASCAADSDAADWTKDYDPRKEAVGYYRRTSVVKDGETYEEMLQLRNVGSRGYLSGGRRMNSL